MKRNGSGQSIAAALGQTPYQLKPFAHVREHIQDESVTEVVGISTTEEPIYVSQSYASVGNSTSILRLPHDTLPHSLSADDSMIVGLCNGGSRLFVQKLYSFGVGKINSFVDLPMNQSSCPAKTAVLSAEGSKSVAVVGHNFLATVHVPCRPFGEEKIVELRDTGGAVNAFLRDASGLCLHAVYAEGPWLQVLADGNIVERHSLLPNHALLAADAMKGVFLMRHERSIYLCHGAIHFPLAGDIDPDDHLSTMWGKNDILYLQVGTADLVPALTSVQVHTGSVLDTLFPTGVSPSTVRHFQNVICCGQTMVYNNGVYRLE